MRGGQQRHGHAVAAALGVRLGARQDHQRVGGRGALAYRGLELVRGCYSPHINYLVSPQTATQTPQTNQKFCIQVVHLQITRLGSLVRVYSILISE